MGIIPAVYTSFFALQN